jgi:hypothetical protein
MTTNFFISLSPFWFRNLAQSEKDARYYNNESANIFCSTCTLFIRSSKFIRHLGGFTLSISYQKSQWIYIYIYIYIHGGKGATYHLHPLDPPPRGLHYMSGLWNGSATALPAQPVHMVHSVSTQAEWQWICPTAPYTFDTQISCYLTLSRLGPG